MNVSAVLKAETRRVLVTQRRYWFSTLTNLIVFGVVSVGGWIALRKAFFRGEDVYAASAALLWPLVLGSFGIASDVLKEDIELGTIEQIYLSASSVLRLLHLRSLVSFLETLVFTAPMLLIGGYYMGWSTLGRWMVVQVIPLWVGLYGLGLALAGLLLVYRRLGSLTNLLGMVVMALAVVNLPGNGAWVWLRHLFPMVGASAVVGWPEGWWLRYVVAAFYLLVGAWGFCRLEARAKRLGLIGKY